MPSQAPPRIEQSVPFGLAPMGPVPHASGSVETAPRSRVHDGEPVSERSARPEATAGAVVPTERTASRVAAPREISAVESVPATKGTVEVADRPGFALPPEARAAAPQRAAAAPADVPLPAALAPIAHAVVEMAKLERPTFRMRIRHDELGGIDISVRRGPQGVVVEITADSSETRRILAGQIPALGQEIRSSGVALEALNVGNGSAHAQESFTSGRQDERGAQQAAPSFPRAPFVDASPRRLVESRPDRGRGASSLDLLA